MKNDGYKNELNYIDMLNGRRFGGLAEFPKSIIRFMFPDIKVIDKIEAWKYVFQAKPDIVIKAKKQERYVSIKSGKSTYIHCEHIKSFVLFLRTLGISEETQKTILIYQYGDGTMTGNGIKRFNHDELMSAMKNRIITANQELNKKEIIEKVIERCMFTAGHTETKPAEYILYGYTDYGTIVSKDELMNYALSHKYDYIKTLHFGPVTMSPYMRDVDRKSKYQEKRHLIKAEWNNLLADMEKIRNHK